MELVFWHGFLPLFLGIEISIFLKRNYLAYTILMAGWLIFCYWLYAKQLYPRFHMVQGTTWPVFDDDLDVPLAFNWGSDILVAGEGFDEWVDQLLNVDSSENILILRAYYFRDEAGSIDEGKKLGKKRVDRVIEYLGFRNDRMMIEIISKEVDADVRSNPFEAFSYEVVSNQAILNIRVDTMEVCFPVKDSFLLPVFFYDEFDAWLATKSDKKESTTYVIGMADGTGISESGDVAWERAIVIQNKLIDNGWTEDRINITTEQRNYSESIRNRCVMIYFD